MTMFSLIKQRVAILQQFSDEELHELLTTGTSTRFQQIVPTPAMADRITDAIAQVVMNFTNEQTARYEAELRAIEQRRIHGHNETIDRTDITLAADASLRHILSLQASSIEAIRMIEGFRLTETHDREKIIEDEIKAIREITQHGIAAIQAITQQAVMIQEEHHARETTSNEAALTREAIAREQARHLAAIPRSIIPPVASSSIGSHPIHMAGVSNQSLHDTHLRHVSPTRNTASTENADEKLLRDAMARRRTVETNAHRSTASSSQEVDPSLLTFAQRRQLMEQKAKAAEEEAKKAKKPGPKK